MTKKIKFGRWQLDTEAGFLTFKSDLPDYEIPLWEIDNSAKILEWIYQSAEKTWMTPTDLKNLIDAFVHIFGRMVCSRGVDHPFNAKHLLRARFGTKF